MAVQFGEILKKAVERVTEAFSCISTDHAYIHAGKAFTISGRVASIEAAGTYSFSFTTPETGKYIHWRPTMLSSSANIIEGRLAEASTVTGGSAATPFNRRRVGTPPASVVTAKTGVTISSEGATKLDYMVVGSGGIPVSTRGGVSGQDIEIILKPNTTYSYRIENIGATTATSVGYSFFWYEEEGA